jgi:protein-S-isoprenylcysteine O-methyltransferase Ste14
MKYFKYFPPPVIALLSLTLGELLNRLLEPASTLNLFLPGAILLGGGLLLGAWALWFFLRKRTTFLPHGTPIFLVLDGPYRHSRNPMYVGLLAVLLGGVLWMGSWPHLTAPLLFFVVMDKFYIPHEETRLERLFGEDYRRFKSGVRRWL